MQTFLAFSDLKQSASVLDDARLRKQQVEGGQIYNALTSPTTKGWINHPAVLQWKGFEKGLLFYCKSISDECKNRGFKFHFSDLGIEPEPLPPWVGNEDLHKSHRSRLLFKGRVDSVCESVKKFVKVRSIKSWLKDRGYPDKNIFKLPDILRLEQFALENKIAIGPNYYKQFNWSEPDTIPYFWPTKNGY